jgi:predicted DsbA family dithiol-disulfide isomerase
MATTPPTSILCFTDVLCGFCYLADARFEQLQADFGSQVQLSFHFMSAFGDVRRRLDRSGKSDRAYGAMVREILGRYDHVAVHPNVFHKDLPASSTPAHLYLRAVMLLEDEGALDLGSGGSAFERMMREIRLAFFRDSRNVSKRRVLDEIAEELEIPRGPVARVIDDGRAFAELAHDAELQRKHDVKMTPTLVLDDGRTLLSGNVGYGTIEANVRELALRDCEDRAPPVERRTFTAPFRTRSERKNP